MKLRTVGALASVVIGGLLLSSAAQAASRPEPKPTIEWVRDLLDPQGVTPVNIFTRTAGAQIPITGPLHRVEAPEGIAVTPDGKTAYVVSDTDVDFEPATVTPVDLVTRTAEPQITLPPGQPTGVAVAPDGKTAYVVDAETGPGVVGSIIPINVATNTPGTPILVPNLSGQLAISPDGKTLWVESETFANATKLWLTPIDLATDTPGTTFMIGSGVNFGAADLTITSNGQTLYATTTRFQLLRVDTATHAVTVIALPHNSTYWAASFGVAVNPAGTEVLVGTENFDPAFMVPVRVATNAVGAPIPLPSSNFGTVAWGPAGKTAWADGVTPVTGRAVGASVPTDQSPSVAMTPDQPPVARFTTTHHGLQARFDADASYPQSTPIATYAWNFGDGSKTTTTTPITTHTYAASGTYTVTVTLTDTAGTSTTQVYTGRSMLRNGSSIAQAVKKIPIG
jgi:PKD repeat protein